MLVLFGMKQMEDRAKLLDQRKGSTMGRVCIPRNRALGHEQLNTGPRIREKDPL
jgi:hypothetical protein